MTSTPEFVQNTIAMVYDFDGTLCPQPMQEYTVLPKLGIQPEEFWRWVEEDAKQTGGEKMLVYMRLLLEEANNRRVYISRDDFRKMGKDIEYFPGVQEWFSKINQYVKRQSQGSVTIQHYIISAGMKEILEGISIRKFFKQIYASEYHFNFQGLATFPKQLITDTTKTQYLFRVNKGKEALEESINEHMPEWLRPIPFENIIYIGDGMTDVPSMALTKKNGGHTIAVYPSEDAQDQATCIKLLKAKRVDFIAPANYQKDSPLFHRVQLLLNKILSSMAYQQEVFTSQLHYGIVDHD
ncbi:MAG: haloacid dehalogenase-like hydrolase [Ferrovum sp. 21-44-67]|uniref:haloacid dehalogenase-like hydrolase n=1 Tax=Ferrovum sp. JA12 TaxID=1356299 RepID=UPI0007024EAE|nr:haloacid dehalogenase-like hydrolase [Ferrovum sp. JA12]KRH79305.1 haloacid dehalogenase-like hydrolase [Ferrovum sp. JA12]OYV78655.1 MAG: haloacid dehalogenase-like hydrolase [Ferrovum sp. 21-44-67]HQT82343.1 haloacid dehalogenase-like hydrolase [Ferrovaceae bacterium]HQU06846.1 haloacid dehalogenase-like hydrolase [Ferrovaceae bacterium]